MRCAHRNLPHRVAACPNQSCGELPTLDSENIPPANRRLIASAEQHGPCQPSRPGLVHRFRNPQGTGTQRSERPSIGRVEVGQKFVTPCLTCSTELICPGTEQP